jgi:hypothetical protein
VNQGNTGECRPPVKKLHPSTATSAQLAKYKLALKRNDAVARKTINIAHSRAKQTSIRIAPTA